MDKNKGMMIVIIVMLGLIIVALVVGAILLLGQFNRGNQMQAEGLTPGFVQEISEQDIRTITLSNDITTNLLSHDGGRHVVRVTVGVGINNTDTDEADDFIDMLLEREIVMKDIATNILRRTTRDQLAAVGGTEDVAEQILTALQDAFGSQLIVRVYLGNLVTS
ncbi:MAG: flagellar basal body-associated FliL family protein [Clostridiales bacterium]|jgi:flagellar basal body-associated protein FliL|nr:flagellar basal body-associated FliL family protein [Clostridiales bacterium]